MHAPQHSAIVFVLKLGDAHGALEATLSAFAAEEKAARFVERARRECRVERGELGAADRCRGGRRDVSTAMRICMLSSSITSMR